MNKWGGYFEALESCERENEENQDITESNFLLKNLKEKLTLLENSKSFEEIVNIISRFSKENYDYLNSPLLDEICDTIQEKDPMLFCCEKNKKRALEFYLEREKFSQINKGLIFASFNGHIEIVKFLLKNKANPTYICNSSLILASEKNHVKIVEILLENGASQKNTAAIFLACNNGAKDVVELLLKNGSDPNESFNGTKNFPGQEPIYLLTIAVEKKYIEIIKILLVYGANVHAAKNEALIKAIYSSSIEIIKLLLENGADVSENDALLRACERNESEIVELLLKHGARATNLHFLWYGTTKNYTEIVKLLLTYQPTLDINLCLHYACRTECSELVKFLSDHGAVLDENSACLQYACEAGNLEIVKVLIEHIRERDTFSSTISKLLQVSFACSQKEVMEFFLRQGTSVHGDYEVLLRKAIIKGDKDIVELLIKYGADVHVGDNFLFRNDYVPLIKGDMRKLLLEHY